MTWIWVVTIKEKILTEKYEEDRNKIVKGYLKKKKMKVNQSHDFYKTDWAQSNNKKKFKKKKTKR